jgi:hypothetical protein
VELRCDVVACERGGGLGVALPRGGRFRRARCSGGGGGFARRVCPLVEAGVEVPEPVEARRDVRLARRLLAARAEERSLALGAGCGHGGKPGAQCGAAAACHQRCSAAQCDSVDDGSVACKQITPCLQQREDSRQQLQVASKQLQCAQQTWHVFKRRHLLLQYQFGWSQSEL